MFGRLSGLSGPRVAFARVSLGAFFLLPILKFRKKLGYTLVKLKEKPLHLLAPGASLALNWAFLFTAFNYTTIANAVLVYYVSPALAMLISWRFLGESLDRRNVAGIGMAFTGLLLITSSQKISLSDRDFMGIVLAFLAAFFYALIPNLGRFLRDIDGESLTFFQLAIAALLLLPFVAVNRAGRPVW